MAVLLHDTHAANLDRYRYSFFFFTKSNPNPAALHISLVFIVFFLRVSTWLHVELRMIQHLGYPPMLCLPRNFDSAVVFRAETRRLLPALPVDHSASNQTLLGLASRCRVLKFGGEAVGTSAAPFEDSFIFRSNDIEVACGCLGKPVSLHDTDSHHCEALKCSLALI